jgi:hypothetical protein
VADHEDKQPERQDPRSLAREVGSSLKAEVRSWLRWALWGAGFGAIALGAGGAWFFGATGFAYGAAIGAVAGGIGAWLLYLNATSVSL